MPWQEDTSQKVLGSNPSSCKGFFQIFICTLHELYNVLILVINTYIHACGRCTHKIKITLSKCFILAKNINCQNILFKFQIFFALKQIKNYGNSLAICSELDASQEACLFCINVQLLDKSLQMLGFKPRISGVRCDHSAHWATTTTLEHFN